MKILFLLTFLLVYLFCGLELGYTATSPWWTHITYAFQHANLMHLLLNSISFNFMFRLLQRFIAPWKIATLSLSVAAFASFLLATVSTLRPFVVNCQLSIVNSSIPTVGASGMIYAMIGIFVSFTISGRARYRSRLNLIIFFICLTISLVLGFFRQNTAALLHLTCLIYGITASFVYTKLLKK